jgi:hypothetical protein
MVLLTILPFILSLFPCILVAYKKSNTVLAGSMRILKFLMSFCGIPALAEPNCYRSFLPRLEKLCESTPLSSRSMFSQAELSKYAEIFQAQGQVNGFLPGTT